jgi:leucyl-tRNA synthetase
LPGRDHFTVSHGGTHTFPEVLTEILGEDPLPVGIFPVPEKELPVELPRVEKYEPTGTGESPLAAMDTWVQTTCPQCGGPAKRETNTMPQWAGSNWYFLRYCDPHNEKKLADPKKLAHWLPVDVYIGGAEHAVLHLLYARFIYKFLCDIEVIPKALVKEKGDEPFKKLKNQGLILGEDGQKMSKSRGNVINPDEVVEQYGADAMRMYEMFMGPFEDPKPWSTRGIIGITRFLEKVWEMKDQVGKHSLPDDPDALRKMHQTVKKVTEYIESFKFNTVVSTLMEYVNYLRSRNTQLTQQELWVFIQLLSPFAPHLAEELWSSLKGNGKDELSHAPWPIPAEQYLSNLSFKIMIQINGKIRDEIEMPVDTSEAEITTVALAREKVQKWLAGKEPKKVLYVKGKLVSIVV